MKTSAIRSVADTVVFLTLCVVSAATFAESQNEHRGPPPAERILERFDVNQDGSVSQDEIDQVVQNSLSQHDKNGSGSLELEEFLGFHADNARTRNVNRFERLDANGNASLDSKELQKPLQRMMQRLDSDGNGELSSEELSQVRRRKHSS